MEFEFAMLCVSERERERYVRVGGNRELSFVKGMREGGGGIMGRQFIIGPSGAVTLNRPLGQWAHLLPFFSFFTFFCPFIVFIIIPFSRMNKSTNVGETC